MTHLGFRAEFIQVAYIVTVRDPFFVGVFQKHNFDRGGHPSIDLQARGQTFWFAKWRSELAYLLYLDVTTACAHSQDNGLKGCDGANVTIFGFRSAKTTDLLLFVFLVAQTATTDPGCSSETAG